ncbi:hypothetical protein [Capnocytophaga leadbetteri]
MPATAIKINRLTGSTVDKVPMVAECQKVGSDERKKVICDTCIIT